MAYYFVTLSSGASSVTLPPPLFGYKTAIQMPLDFTDIENGSIDSFDHGTAYDIAGTGKANPKSLMNAIKVATQMVLSQDNEND